MSEKTWTLEMQDDGGSTETVEFDALPTSDEISEACQEWCRGGEWGTDGAAICIGWTLTDDDGEEIDSGGETVEIEPDHAAIIGKACGYEWDEAGKTIRGCGEDPDDHDWTAEGEGGCDQNPGVWSTGGTSMTFSTHCRTCGLKRTEHSTGSQRNPGDHDTVSYEMPDSWCAECQREECNCEE
jgi:hypothetical protein